jgi:hypothetical protein
MTLHVIFYESSPDALELILNPSLATARSVL